MIGNREFIQIKEKSLQLLYGITSRIELVAAIILGIIVILMYDFIMAKVRYPYSPDSACYIEMARNLLNGDGLKCTPWGIHPLGIDKVHPNVFPPGFSILIALVSYVGFDPKDVAYWINRFSGVIIPFVLVSLYSNFIKPVPLLGAAIAIIAAPGLLKNQFFGMSDTIFLAFVVASIGFYVRSSKVILSIVISGVLAGAAYAIRNVGIALLLTIPFSTLFILFFEPKEQRKILVFKILFWLIGVAIVLLPLLFYNFAVFGKIQPYEMPPSSIGWLLNARTFLASLLTEIFGFKGAGYVVWSWVSLLCLVPAIGLTLFFALRLLLSENKDLKLVRDLELVIILIGYTLIGSVIVVYSRTKYQWGEPINDRHVLQYAWAVIIFGLVILKHFNSKISKFSQFFVIGFFIFILSLRAIEFPEFIDQAKKSSSQIKELEIAQDKKIISEISKLSSANTLVASRISWVIRIENSIPARTLSATNEILAEDELLNLCKINPKEYRIFLIFGSAQTQPMNPWRSWLDKYQCQLIFQGEAGQIFSCCKSF